MQRYFAQSREKQELYLFESDLHHIKNVMRMKDREQIEVVFGEKLYICDIHIESSGFHFYINKELEKNKEKRKITLLVPLLKEQKIDFILQKSTELGVYKIIFYEAERSIIKWDSSKAQRKLERWNKICKEASEQSKRLDRPIIDGIWTLQELRNIEGLNLICSTLEKEKNIKSFLHTSSNYDKINIIIGPEGGLTIKEEEQLKKYGYHAVSLGSQILRVETVPIFLMSVINYEYME